MPTRRLPFAAAEQGFSDISAFDKWTGMLARLDRERGVPREWRQSFALMKSIPLRQQAEIVNRQVNAHKYITDAQNWGVSDYWETPAEFYARGGGDCEGFAIAKYGWLRALGVPEERLRLTVVYDLLRHAPHTVLELRADTESLMLDNQSAEIRPLSGLTRYQPIFSIDRRAWYPQAIARKLLVMPLRPSGG